MDSDWIFLKAIVAMIATLILLIIVGTAVMGILVWIWGTFGLFWMCLTVFLVILWAITR